MPFRPSLALDPNPLVRVFFSGLTLVKPSADGNTCEIFVHKIAGPPNHELSIEVRERVPNHRDIIRARISGPFQSPVPGTDNGLIIRTAQSGGIYGYVGPTTIEGAALSGDPLSKALDLNELHPGNTAVHTPAARPSIFMNEAIFYAADITPNGLVIDLYRGTTRVSTLTPFASLIGANIYNTTELIWRQNGQLRSLPLQADASIPGLSYEIYVINDPLFEPLPNPGQQPHDELQEYYKILPHVPPEERFNMVFVSFPSGGRGSSRTPCMSVIDGG